MVGNLYIIQGDVSFDIALFVDQPHKCLHYNSALIISAALTIFLRLASVSGTPLVLSPQSGFTHSLSFSIFVSIIFIARVISSTDGILGE